MGVIRVSDQVQEYLKKQAKGDENLDAVIRRLIGFKKGDENRTYIRRDLLIPRSFFMGHILDAFLAWDRALDFNPVGYGGMTDATLGTGMLRAYVLGVMDREVDIKRYSKDFEKDKKGVERWINRFYSALAHLVKEKILIK